MEMPELKDSYIVKQKETEPIRRVFYTREQIEQVLGIIAINSVVCWIKLSI